MYKKAVCAILAVLVLLSVSSFAGAQEPEVNQAIVEVDGETVVMQVVSMEPRQTEYYGASCFQMEIEFQQIDTRAEATLKTLVLYIPGNFEEGSVYRTGDKGDRVYGDFHIFYKNHQTVNMWSYSTSGPASPFNANAPIEAIIDETNDDYSVIKGRFAGVLTNGVTVTIGASSFYVDKEKFDNPPEPTSLLGPTNSPSETTACDSCSSSGICDICEGTGKIYSVDGVEKDCICTKSGMPGKCVECGGTGFVSVPQ